MKSRAGLMAITRDRPMPQQASEEWVDVHCLDAGRWELGLLKVTWVCGVGMVVRVRGVMWGLGGYCWTPYEAPAGFI